MAADRLVAEAARLAGVPLRQLIHEPDRVARMALRIGPMYVNFARQRLDAAAVDMLFEHAARKDVMGSFRRMLEGEAANSTEGRAALHTALRGDVGQGGPARSARGEALAAHARMQVVISELDAAGVTDVLSLGIGGSDLGPRLVVDALGREPSAPRVHFVSNVDGHALARTLAPLDPARSAMLVISKSFGTQETLANARIARDWLGDGGARTWAVTANTPRAAEFGIGSARVLPMWDWVGGRYSLWSAVGLPIAIACGFGRWQALLAGAAEYDQHCARCEPRRNPSLWHALIALWNREALRFATQAVVPYDERLRLLPAYLQQLVMESLGKSVRADGSAVAGETAPVWWGTVGADAQHSYFQMLHQGTQVVPVDFIGVRKPDHPHANNHALLLANLFAQAEALANGEASEDPHRRHPGDRPSTLVLLDALTPQSLGMLIAFYEHSVQAQGALWGVNAFDQFGVELGKRLADRIQPALCGEREAEDPVTRALIAELNLR